MIDKPNSVPLRAATIYLGALLPSALEQPTRSLCPPVPDPLRGFVLGTELTSLRGLTGLAGKWRAVAPWAPYLVLHPVGFSVPVLSPAPRCALTAPFSPLPDPPRVATRAAIGGVFFCGTVPHPHEKRFLTVAAPMRMGGC